HSTYPIQDIEQAFEILQSESKPLMVILDYGDTNLDQLEEYLSYEKKVIVNSNIKSKNGLINIALVGSGAFASAVHVPNISKLSKKYNLYAVMNRTGQSAKYIANTYGAKYATTSYDEIINDQDIDAVLIATRHDSHAELSLRALNANKHVFVEKPLAINQSELDAIKKFYDSNHTSDKPILFTGFNRRFSPYSNEIRKHTNNRINPLMIQYRMNAGYLPDDHWVHKDGGRI
ncbi:uncharacterized protein METZ01_LOCUS507578, partial [marine metagenome]